MAYLSSRLGAFSQHTSADGEALTDDLEECGLGDDVTDASSTKPTCKLCDQGCRAIEFSCRSVLRLLELIALRIKGNCDIRVWRDDGRTLKSMEGSPETGSGQVSGWLSWSEMALASGMMRCRRVRYSKTVDGDTWQI